MDVGVLPGRNHHAGGLGMGFIARGTDMRVHLVDDHRDSEVGPAARLDGLRITMGLRRHGKSVDTRGASLLTGVVRLGKA